MRKSLSLQRAITFLLILIGVVIALSFFVWYVIKPEAQFFIYWIVGIIVGVLTLLAVIAQFSGYSLRDFLAQQARAQRAAEERIRTERSISLDNTREATLTAYLEKMTSLLLAEGLQASTPDSAVRVVARAETLHVLQTLDNERIITVLRFLHEAKLIRRSSPVVSLHGAELHNFMFRNIDLTDADLSGVKFADGSLLDALLCGANLMSAKLDRVDLRATNLKGACLSRAEFTGCNFEGAKLRDADLSKAQFFGSGLVGADLRDANLESATIVQTDLHEVDWDGANLRSANFIVCRDLDIEALSREQVELARIETKDGLYRPSPEMNKHDSGQE